MPTISRYPSERAFAAACNEFWPVAHHRAAARQTGVDLQMHARNTADLECSVRDLGDGPRRGRRQVDVRCDRLGDRFARRAKPAQDPTADAGRPQRERLLEERDAEPAGAALDGSDRALHESVPVALGLHHGHDVSRTDDLLDARNVRRDRAEIDASRGAQGSRGDRRIAIRHGDILPVRSAAVMGWFPCD